MQGFFVFNFEKILNSFDSTLAHDPCQNQDHPRILEFFLATTNLSTPWTLQEERCVALLLLLLLLLL
jgi:hypothetical protein